MVAASLNEGLYSTDAIWLNPLTIPKMALQNDEKSNEMLLSQAHIWNHIFSFINSMSLKCAIELEIPDIIDRHGAPMLLPELVEALSINKERTPFVYRLMRILVHSGFFVKQTITTATGNGEEEREGYLLAPASQLLLKKEPFSIRPLLLFILDPIMMDPWQHMSKWFQNDDVTPFHTTYERSIWDHASQDPKLNQFINETMASDASGLEGSKNMSYTCGDMFEAIPKADAVLLKWTLHDWNDEECIKILKRCKEAIPGKEYGGKVIIIDMVLKTEEGDEKSLETQLFFDMLMMVNLTGRERTEKDWSKLFFDACFSHYKITPILGLRSIIEVYP
ncbi:hypothetical protein L2E82_40983 [Cichorium intybus]|uniref:Uncharacterized protein n=1 Tax=Cichorium intybus TaxID=13427 RepID=A0ACB9AM56_CICIN|nr:hypothetical protein L2E82_40983 [Cichorium intybus]